MPRAVQQAYRKGTRSPDGRPGPSYWQNRGRYNIAITALPPNRTIRGSEQVTYFNNSPDTLRNPIIKLFLNIHKPGAPRVGGAPADYLTSGVHIDSLAVNGQAMLWPCGENCFTWQRLALPAPLSPHDSVHLSFKWHFDISKRSGREGMIDSTTWFLAYFYPRVAVFDDYNGWDTMNFTDMQEFYSDFNDYDVSITVPGNYVVWGTGTLLNAAELLQPTYLQRYTQSFTADPSPQEDLPIVTPADALSGGAYGNNAYGKPALGYLALKDLLGDAAFGKALHAFIDRWHGKHPIPWDFFNTFNDVTGQNLNWFWNSWYFSNNYIDVAIAGVSKTGDGYSVTIDNIGGMPTPLDLEAHYGDGSSDVVHQTPAIWQGNPRRASVAIPTRKLLQSVTLNSGIWVDADSTNNRWTQR